MGYLLIILGILLTPALANAAEASDLIIGYLELDDDPRYREKRTYARFLMQPLGKPYAGAEVALRESRFVGKALGIDFAIERVTGKDNAALLKAIDELAAKGIHLFLVDAPALTVAALAQATKGRDLLLFNVSARDDVLRQTQCQAHLLHAIPNHAMFTDALVQYLLFRKWRQVLMLVGPRPEDVQLATAFERSAKRYGAKIVAQRPFVLSNDPRERERNNVALLTGGKDYDVVFVADTDGEFARSVPYQTVKPRPVVGSEGLAAAAWHWSWERHGASQLNKRFEKRAKRPMTDSGSCSRIVGDTFHAE